MMLSSQQAEKDRLKSNRTYFEDGCACIHTTKTLVPCPSSVPDAEAVRFYELNCRCTRNYVRGSQSMNDDRRAELEYAFQWGSESVGQGLDLDQAVALPEVQARIGQDEEALEEFYAGWRANSSARYSEYEAWIPLNKPDAVKARLEALQGYNRESFSLAIMTEIANGNSILKSAFPEYAHADPATSFTRPKAE